MNTFFSYLLSKIYNALAFKIVIFESTWKLKKGGILQHL